MRTETPAESAGSIGIRIALAIIFTFCCAALGFAQTSVPLGTFNAGAWSGNYYIYDWLAFSPSSTGTLTQVNSQLFSCVNGACGRDPAYYVICSINAGHYNSCPSANLVAISDPAYGYAIANGTPNLKPMSFNFSGSNQATLRAGQVYYVRPYICTYGPYYCGSGHAMGGGLQTFTGSSVGIAPVISNGSPVQQNSSGMSLTGPSQSSTSQQGQSAEPISTGSGNYFYQHTDFTLTVRGFPLVFKRTYNSFDDYSGPLGANWNHSYNIALSQTAEGVATIRWADGHGETYSLKNGVYVPQAGVYNTLIANQDGTFTLTKKNRMQYDFSSAGKLSAIRDKDGNTTAFTYDTSGNLVTVTAPGGRILTLSYDTQDRIVSVTDPMGRTESYVYDDAGDLVSATDPLGGVTKYVYDSAHHVTQITLPNGNILLQNAYDSQGRVISQTNGRGFAWQFAYDTPDSGQTTITDARGNKTIHTYDSSLRIVGITDALGHSKSYTYDSNNDRTSVTNQNGNTTGFSYDANGNVTGITDPLSNSTTFTYDEENDLLTVTNPKAKTTTFSYDSHGNLTGIQDPLGDKTVLAYDSDGELTARTDAAGNKTIFTYDSTGDLTGITDALGNETTLSYDSDGRLVSVTDPNHHTATSVYDSLGRLTKVSDPLGDATTFSYDGAGDLLSVTDADGHTTSYGYDGAENLTKVTDALGHVTTYTYDKDNNRVGFTNAKGNTTTYQYDALNRLTDTVDPLSFVTSYSYDDVGNMVAETDAKGQTNRFVYDALNRLISIAYADQKTVTYHYDADGRRTSMVDWTGTTSYKYDDLDRLTSVTFPGNKTVAYAYDPDGQRASLTYPDGKSVAYSYDPDERLSTVTDWLLHVTQYSYDPAGNLVATQYPNKARINYAYDAANRLTSVVNTTMGVPPLAFYYTLDPDGNRTVVKEGGIPTFYGYDALNQLTSAQRRFFKRTWTYDAVGNRSRQVSPFGITHYSYDATDRLLRVGSRSFAYDADGNETSETNTFTHRRRTFTFDAANRLVAVSEGRRTISFNYDGDGNRVSESVRNDVHRFVNDIGARLPVVLQNLNLGRATNSYVYGLNLIEGFRPEGGEEPDGVQAAAQTKMHAGKLAADQHWAERQNGWDFRERDRDIQVANSNYFYQYDGLGSVVQLTNSAGVPDVSYFYDAWGNSTLPAPPTNPYRFTGQAFDQAMGFYYLRARYYDPSIGRFLSRDPLAGISEVPETTNRYSYALSNPPRYRDLSGLSVVGLFESATDFLTSLMPAADDAYQKNQQFSQACGYTGGSLDNCTPQLQQETRAAQIQAIKATGEFAASTPSLIYGGTPMVDDLMWIWTHVQNLITIPVAHAEAPLVPQGPANTLPQYKTGNTSK